MATLPQQIIAATNYFIDWNLQRIARCLDELSEEQVWQRPNANSNSVGNQLLHLNGNIRQWILTGLDGRPDDRERSIEFSSNTGPAKKELLTTLSATIEESKHTISNLSEEEFTRERPVQAYVHDGTFILIHVVEHLSYHVGQIIFWTKLINDIDLGFYRELDADKQS